MALSDDRVTYFTSRSLGQRILPPSSPCSSPAFRHSLPHESSIPSIAGYRYQHPSPLWDRHRYSVLFFQPEDSDHLLHLMLWMEINDSLLATGNETGTHLAGSNIDSVSISSIYQPIWPFSPFRQKMSILFNAAGSSIQRRDTISTERETQREGYVQHHLKPSSKPSCSDRTDLKRALKRTTRSMYLALLYMCKALDNEITKVILGLFELYGAYSGIEMGTHSYAHPVEMNLPVQQEK